MTRLTCPRCQETATAITWPRQETGTRRDRTCPNCDLWVCLSTPMRGRPTISHIQEELEP